MRLSEFLRLAIPSVGVACFIVGILAIVYLIYIFKSKKYQQTPLDIKKLIYRGLLIGYILVVIIATLGRPSYSFDMKASTELFSSYRLAINHFDMREWRNIILNICMFIPLGFLLPLVSSKMKHWWMTYIAGILLTLCIELTQLLTNRGIFEIDDILNNALGCMIGFGLYSLGRYIYQKYKKHQTNMIHTLLTQIPLLLTIIAFSTIFISYSKQELGNLQQNYYKTVDMSHIEVTSLVPLSDETSLQDVYKTKQYTQDECYDIIQPFFNKYGLTIDDTQTDIYDETIYFYSQNREILANIDYSGGTFHLWYTNESDTPQDNLTEQEVKDIIQKEGIQIPQQATFTSLDDGQYIFEVQDIVDHQYLNGSISCQINANKSFISLGYDLKTYDSYKQFPIISQQQAFELIKDGKFNQDWMMSLDQEIVIHSANLIYAEDSKGFYQPVYLFGIENDQIIYIPAIQS